MNDQLDQNQIAPEGDASPPERTRPRPKTTRALPTDRLKFDMQVRALRALAMESQNGSRGVSAADLARRLGVAEATAGLNNVFFVEAGLAEKAGKGRYKPTQATLSFERGAGFESEDVSARKHLAEPLSNRWFYDEIKSQVALGDSSEARIMTVLAHAAGASGAHRTKLVALLDWLSLAGLITREDGQIRLTGDQATPEPTSEDGQAPEQPAPEVADPGAGSGTTIEAAAKRRGPVVLEVKFSCAYTAEDLAKLEPDQIKALYEAVGGIQAVQAVLLRGRENT